MLRLLDIAFWLLMLGLFVSVVSFPLGLGLLVAGAFYFVLAAYNKNKLVRLHLWRKLTLKEQIDLHEWREAAP